MEKTIVVMVVVVLYIACLIFVQLKYEACLCGIMVRNVASILKDNRFSPQAVKPKTTTFVSAAYMLSTKE